MDTLKLALIAIILFVFADPNIKVSIQIGNKLITFQSTTA